MSKKSIKKGFTLIEVLMVVAVLTVLFGIGTIAVSSIKENLAQTKVDTIARQIYVTAQENFTKMKNSGTDDSIKKNGLVDYESPTAQEVDYPLYYVTSNNENIKSLVPDGIFDFDKNCSYVIEYDPVNCVVTSVFYGEDADINNYYSGEERISLRSYSYRKKFAKENGFHVGFYGDGDDTGHGNDSENRLKLNLYVNNGEDLLLTYTITNVPQKYSESDITLEIEYEGIESHAIYSQKIVSKSRKGEYILDHFNNTVNVDPDENNNKSFNKLFNGGLLANGKKTTNGISFILGEDIEVRAIAHIGSDDETTSSPITKTFNSLFASVSGSGNNRTAYISYARHLQNLDNCLDNATFAVGTAIQNKDIVVPTNSNTKEVYKFMPIVNDNLYCYEGNGHTISNIYITTVNSAKQELTGAGLFGRFGNIGKEKNYIKDLGLIDTVVLCDNANSGSLVGNVTTSLELINVGSYLQNVDIEHEPSIYISGNNAGGLIGYASNGLTVDRCFAATVVKATGKYSSEEVLNGYAGGFIGISAKPSTYTNSYADSYVRGDVVGGFAGKTDGSSFESCYTVGFNYGSSVMAAGFTPSKNITGVNSYTAFLYGVADYQYSTYISGTANQVCYLIDLSTENAIGTEVEADVLTDKTRLQTNLGNGNFTLSNATKSHPYNFNYGTLKVYPYPTINSIDHYGDWDSDNDGMPQTGFFYWEYESGGAKPGYNYYMIFSDGTSPIDTLYKGHDDGGIITEYGYGFIIKSQKYYDGCFTWDKYSNGSKATQNGVASEAIRKQLTNPNTYKVVAYNTMDAANDGGRFDKANWHASDTFQETDYTDYIITTKDLILASSKQCTTVTLKGLGSQKTETYTFNPFFAADMVAGDEEDYIAAYRGKNRTNDHQIRCIEQLQYINWNYSELNCHTLCDATISDDYLLNWTRFTFLYDMGLDTSLISNWKRSGYLQTHDIDASGFNYTPIAAMGSVAYTTNGVNIAVLKTVDSILPSSSLYVFDWFGDDYNGQSYLIEDLTISTNAYTIGIFGTTIGANLENIILYSENGATITRTSGVPNGLGSIVPISDYFIGGIVGLCSDGSSLTKFSDGSLVTGVIDNCAVGGYKINDYTSQASTTGSSAVGGLVGSSTVRIKNCSADVDIYVDSTSTFGDIAVGGLAGSVSTNTFDDTISSVFLTISSGSTDIDEYVESLKSYATVYNCYSAGSIAISHDCRFSSVATKRYVVAGLIGTTLNTKVFNVINAGGTFNYPVGILNCYTFMDLPERQTADNIQSIGGMIAKIELNGSLYYSSWLLNDYVYSGKGYDFISGSQFVECQSNIVVDENITGKLLGTVDSLSYNDMTQKRSKNPSTTTAVKTYDCGFDCGNSYPFVAVIKRGNTPIAVSRWPASTQIILQKDGGSGGFSYYVAPNSKASDLNISTIQGYLTKAGYTLEGYYYNDEKVINSDGTFVSTSSFFTNGEWNKGSETYTFVGKWNLITYYIKLNIPESKYLNIDYKLWDTIKYNVETPTFTLPYPEKDGLTFVGWKNSITGYSLKDVVINKGSTGNLEYNAVFGENVYNIIYHGLEGATLSKENPTTYRYIQTITLTNPEKKGYDFVGWKGTNINGTSTRVTWSFNKGDKEFTAVWKEKEGILTYHYNDNKTDDKKIPYKYGDNITIETPSRDYYKFIEWTGNWGPYELHVKGGSKMPSTIWGDVDLTAQWTPIYYTVTYVLNYDNIVDTRKDAYSVVYDNYKLITPNARTGYTFEGWYDSTGTKVEYIPIGSHGDKVFYAHWSPTSYSIYYYLDGGTNNSNNPSSYTYLDSITLKEPAKSGYTFKGWYSDSSFKNKVTGISLNSTGTKTFFAKWEINSYPITYYLNGGTNSSSNKTSYNCNDTITLANPTRTGYTFKGWYSDSAFKNKVTGIAKGSTGAKVFYAKWQLTNYSITYNNIDSNTNNSSNPKTYTMDDNITLVDPNRTGYTFKGWYSDSAFKNKVTGIAKGSTGAKVFYAKWETIPYSITYYTNGGTNNSSNPITYSIENVIELQDPTKTNYRFLGWYSDSAFKNKVTGIAKGSTGAKVFYAKWQKEYTITYNLNGGTNNSGNISKYIQGESFTFKDPTYDASHVFDGWYDENDNKITSFTASATGDITLNARWLLKIYVQSSYFNSGVASEQYYDITEKKIKNYKYYTDSKTIEINGTSFSRPGGSTITGGKWTLIGWCVKNTNGTYEKVLEANGDLSSNASITQTVTIFPIWEATSNTTFYKEFIGGYLDAGKYIVVSPFSLNSSWYYMVPETSKTYHALRVRDVYKLKGEKININVVTTHNSSGTIYYMIDNISSTSISKYWTISSSGTKYFRYLDNTGYLEFYSFGHMSNLSKDNYRLYEMYYDATINKQLRGRTEEDNSVGVKYVQNNDKINITTDGNLENITSIILYKEMPKGTTITDYEIH